MADTKVCKCCGNTFPKHYKDSRSQWAGRQFCSPECSNKSKPLELPHRKFWEKTKKQEGNKCWLWTGKLDAYGYGKIGYGTRTNKRDIKAHRLSYEMRFGPIPEGKVICHTCDNPACVNPHHLFEGTQKDNMQDASRKGRLNPISQLNLRPGAKNCIGAGPKSKKEIQNVISQ